MLNNYIAVLVAAIAAFAVGALWYGPIFGKTWRKLMGVETMSAPAKNMMMKSMIGGFVATLVMVYVLAIFMNAAGVMTAGESVWVAVLIVIGFVATTMSNMVWYERKPWKLWFINVGHYLVALSVAALVLFYW